MCRMIGFSFKEERPIEQLFTHLQHMARDGKCSPHDHGWGIYGLNDGHVFYHRSEKPVFDDSFPSLKLKTGIIHARKASKDLPVSLLQIHPFIDDSGKAFCHNGTIDGIPFKFIKSDSYSYFLSIKQFSSYEDLREKIADVDKNYRYTSMNFLMINKGDLVVYCGYSTNPDYYTLWYKNTEGFVVCSEPMGDNYLPMENKTIFVVRDGEIVSKLSL